MPSIAKFLGGGRKAPRMVSRDQLTALVRQLREHGEHRDRPVAPTLAKARYHFHPEQGSRGDWRIRGSLQGRVKSDRPVCWVCSTNGGAWVHAAAGWWRTREAAEAALERALAEAYADEIAEAEAEEARKAAGCVLRDRFADRLRALEVRRKALGGRYFLSMYPEGFSTGGPMKPYTEEVVAELEAKIAEDEARAERKAEFEAAAPELIARLEVAGLQARLSAYGLEIVEDRRWTTKFKPADEGALEAFRAFVDEQTKPAASVQDLMNMFNKS